MHLLPHILASGDDDMVKVVGAIIFIVISLIGAISSGLKKPKKPGTQQSWDTALRGLGGGAAQPPPMPQQARPMERLGQRPTPRPVAKPPAIRRPPARKPALRRPPQAQPSPFAPAGGGRMVAQAQPPQQAGKLSAPMPAMPESRVRESAPALQTTSAGASGASATKRGSAAIAPGTRTTSAGATGASATQHGISTAVPSADATAIARWMSPATLRQQFILTEIFQPPKALRGQGQ